jgi:dipeptidyl aminopeptidase/acylaminoacyl peptidase
VDKERASSLFILRVTAVALVLGVIAFVVGSVAVAFFLTSELRRPVGSFEKYLPTTTETVEFKTADNVTLRGWLAIPAGASKAVILLHGHGSTRRQMLARAGLLFEHGYAVLLYDARAHGESGGKRNTAGWREVDDLSAAAELLRHRGFAEYGCIGASQGGATIVLAASQLKGLRWAVLESVYPSMRAALDHRFRRTLGVPGWLAGCIFVPIAESRIGAKIDDIAPINSISRLHCPVLIAGGENDLETPPDETRALCAAANEPKQLWIVPAAHHVDLFGFAKERYAERLMAFIANAEGHD